MRQIHYQGEGTDAYPEWGMKHGWMERTPNGTLMLSFPNQNSTVMEIVDRFGERIYPDPEGTAKAQERIDSRLANLKAGYYTTGRKLDGRENISAALTDECAHGLERSICTICAIDDITDFFVA